jgi:GT2 family glycosyltransferase
VHAREISKVAVHEVYNSEIDPSPDVLVAAVILGNAAQLKAWMIDLCRNTDSSVAVDLLCNGPLEANEVIMAAKWLGEVMRRQVRIFLVNRNIGFNGGVNALVKRSNSKYMLISNTDVRYSNLEFERMRHLAEAGAIVAPRQFNSTGALQHLGLKIREEKKLIHGKILTFVQSELIGRNTYPAEEDSKERVVKYFGAAAFFATTEILGALGPFDLGFIYAYHEDTDLAHRHNALGGHVMVSSALDIIHYESSASQVDLPKTFMIAANTIRVGEKIGMDHRITKVTP